MKSPPALSHAFGLIPSFDHFCFNLYHPTAFGHIRDRQQATGAGELGWKPFNSPRKPLKLLGDIILTIAVFLSDLAYVLRRFSETKSWAWQTKTGSWKRHAFAGIMVMTSVVHLSRKLVQGLPFLAKEIQVWVSTRTPWFIARPRIVHLWRNGPCDGGCIMCHFGFTRGPAREALFRSPVTDDMIPGLLHQIRELGGRGTIVSYMCGEPLLNRATLDWIRQARELNLAFRFTTNGYHVDHEVARQLVAANLFNLGVSLESLDPAINEQIRPHPNATAKTLNAIEWLLEEKQRQHSAMSLNLGC